MKPEEVYKKYEGQLVDVAVPNHTNPNKLFFYVGKLLEVNSEYLLLETDRGIRRVPTNDVIEFKLAVRRF